MFRYSLFHGIPVVPSRILRQPIVKLQPGQHCRCAPMTDWVNIFRAIQASCPHSNIITSRWLPSHAAATTRAKASIYLHRVTKIGGLTLRPFEGLSRKPNTCNECRTGLSPAQCAVAMSGTIGVFGGSETYITA
jgi:hypothetical protein